MVVHAEYSSKFRDVAAAPPSAANDPDDVQHGARFVVDGHTLVAIAHSHPDAGGATQRTLVGRITFSGRRYLVYDVEISADAETEPPAVEILTRRELQIALLIGEGKCDKEIAQQLGISGYTVREHIRRIFAKLKIGRRAAIVSYVLRQPANGII